MSRVERIIAKAGLTGLLALLLTVSVAANLWQLYRAGGATARCEATQAESAATVLEAAAEGDTAALGVADDTKARADAAVTAVQAETIERQETVRVIYRTLPAPPAGCPRALPDGVRDALADAAAAANRPL